jgi:glucosyl-3-phosphoglycerate synthase
VADFAQAGLISTLQRLNDGHIAALEEELRGIAQTKSIGLILPCHAADLERPALTHILAELARAEFVTAIVLSVNGIEEAEFERQFGSRFSGRGGVCVLFNPPGGGKGQNVLQAVRFLCKQECDIIATQDCDVASFRRGDLARLCYAVAHPDLGFRYAKAYYSRVTDRLYGRVSRLFLTPLLHAIMRVAGHHPITDFLLSFRYPLSGEMAMTRELAAELPFSDGWGLEIGQLCEVFRRVDPRDVCQVDGGSGYDHKHQPAATALAQMAAEIARELFAQLAAEGLPAGAEFQAAVARAYRREADHALRRSAALARINALPFDVIDETSIVQVFSDRLRELSRVNHEDTKDTQEG